MTSVDAAQEEREARMAWWHEAKFGMFVHWGCYSVLGRGEQVLVRDLMPLDEYRLLGGNFLFNIGPDERGHVAPRDRSGLDRIGKWMEKHGEAVYGTSPERIYRSANQGPCYHYGMFTCKGDTAYLTLFYYPGDYVVISKVGPNILSAELLTTGERLRVQPLRNARWKISGLPAEPPCDLAPVVKLQFDGTPYQLSFDDASWLDGEFESTHA